MGQHISGSKTELVEVYTNKMHILDGLFYHCFVTMIQHRWTKRYVLTCVWKMIVIVVWVVTMETCRMVGEFSWVNWVGGNWFLFVEDSHLDFLLIVSNFCVALLAWFRLRLYFAWVEFLGGRLTCTNAWPGYGLQSVLRRGYCYCLLMESIPLHCLKISNSCQCRVNMLSMKI